jgi:hypothetical protein
MMRTLFRILSAWRWSRAASRGPEAVGRRAVRVAAHRWLARLLR